MPRALALALMMILAFTARATVSFAATSGATAPCGDRVQAFNEYEVMISGHPVEKYSVFTLGAWSNNSSFQGLLISSTENADTLKLGNSKAKFAPWNRDRHFKVAEGLEPDAAISRKEKKYKVQLLKNDKVLCEDSYPIETED